MNFLQFFALTGYFFVGIFLAILFTYLLFTLALCFPFCLKLQLLIVNHRLLTSSSSKRRQPTGNRPFSIQNSHSLSLASVGQLTGNNKLSNSQRSISRSIGLGIAHPDNRLLSNVYNNLYEFGPAEFSGNFGNSSTPFANRLPVVSSTLPNNRSSAGKLTNLAANLATNQFDRQFTRCSQPTNLNSTNRERIYMKLCKQDFVHPNAFAWNS